MKMTVSLASSDQRKIPDSEQPCDVFKRPDHAAATTRRHHVEELRRRGAILDGRIADEILSFDDDGRWQGQMHVIAQATAELAADWAMTVATAAPFATLPWPRSRGLERVPYNDGAKRLARVAWARVQAMQAAITAAGADQPMKHTGMPAGVLAGMIASGLARPPAGPPAKWTRGELARPRFTEIDPTEIVCLVARLARAADGLSTGRRHAVVLNGEIVTARFDVAHRAVLIGIPETGQRTGRTAKMHYAFRRGDGLCRFDWTSIDHLFS